MCECVCGDRLVGVDAERLLNEDNGVLYKGIFNHYAKYPKNTFTSFAVSVIDSFIIPPGLYLRHFLNTY